jgi:S1-C subfamily serine protease
MKNSRNLLVVLIALGSLSVCAVIALLVFMPDGPLSSLQASFISKPAMRVFVQAPPVVSVGEEFVMVVAVYNDGQDILKVDEIRFPLELLEIATIKNIFPGSLTQTGFDGQTTGFQVEYFIPPGAYQEFQITILPRTPGDVLSDLLVGSASQVAAGGFRLLFEPVATPEPSETPTEAPTPTATPAPPTPTPTPSGPPYHAVVRIKPVDTRGRYYSLGSGTIISPDGLIITNAHIVEPQRGSTQISEIIVAMSIDPDEPPVDSYLAEVIKSDANIDIAILRIFADISDQPIDPNSLDLPHATLGDSDQLQLGDPLIILGYPIIGGDTITLTRGDVSGFTSEGRYGARAFIKTSAMIAAGASGGLAIDQNGYMIAIPTQLGSGGDDDLVDCRLLADTNLDGKINQKDICVPVGGFINALRPINMALYLIEAAKMEMKATPTIPFTDTPVVMPTSSTPTP